MGRLVAGRWVDQAEDPNHASGRFVRPEQTFRDWVTPDGSPGPGGRRGFRAEPDRYHLYASYACPWAHRALIFRRLKGLDRFIGLSIVNWFMGEEGWTFEPDEEGVAGDRLLGKERLSDVYVEADPNFTGRVTTPVLWDRLSNTIVNNESSEIIRMFNSAFDACGARKVDFYPSDLRGDIDAINARVYANLNNGVYRCGFAQTQAAYEEAVWPLFETLDWLEERLSTRMWLCGDRLTEADWRLFPTLVRFDPVYFGHFKCNLRRIVDYRELWDYTRALYQGFGISDTVHLDHIKRHYYGSHRNINPTGITPVGPAIDFSGPSRRMDALNQIWSGDRETDRML